MITWLADNPTHVVVACLAIAYLAAAGFFVYLVCTGPRRYKEERDRKS